MPVLVFVRDLSLLDADRLAACGAKFNVNFLEAFAAVRLRRFHEVALAAQQFITVKTCKVGHVPTTAFGFGAFVGENYLKKNI